jgi:hypothetical protein
MENNQETCIKYIHITANILWHDAWESESFIARQRLGKHIPAEANAPNNRREVFSVVSAALFATKLCGKHISATVNQHATIEEAVFSVGAAPRLYNEDLRQLRDKTGSI